VYAGPSPYPTAPRLPEINRKQAALIDWLKTQPVEGILLRAPENVAWFTAGVRGEGELDATHLAIYVAPESRVLVTSENVARPLLEGPLEGLGFQVKLRGWQEDPQVLLEDLCRERRIAHDLPHPPSPADPKLRTWLAETRPVLTPYEQAELRDLSRGLAAALEATARTLRPTDSREEVLGMLAHRLWRRRIEPVQIRVGGGEPPGGKIAESVAAEGTGRGGLEVAPWASGSRGTGCFLWACGRRAGLHATASRGLSWGPPHPAFKRQFELASLAAAAGGAWLTPGTGFSAVWERLERLCQRQGWAGDWTWPELAFVTGYRGQELGLRPSTPRPIVPGMGVTWQPSLSEVTVADTWLMGPHSLEWITRSTDWPELRVDIGDQTQFLPALLTRDEWK